MRINPINTANSYRQKLQASGNALITEPTIKRRKNTDYTTFTSSASFHNVPTEEFVNVKKLLTESFLDLLAKEKAGDKVSIPNSIVLYGKSFASKGRLHSFLNWELGNGLEKISFDSRNPNTIFNLVQKSAVKAEKLYNQTKQRTLLQISKLDELFSDKSFEGIARTDRFKAIANDFSEKFHTTVLLKIDRNIDSAQKVAEDDFFKLKLKLDENPPELPKPVPVEPKKSSDYYNGDGVVTRNSLDAINHYMRMEQFDLPRRLINDGIC